MHGGDLPMKNTARSIILLIIALLLSLSAVAAEGSGVWWEGMPMTAFRYEGLKNVSADRVDRLLSPYLGQPFSDELFGEMNALLYSQEWVSYVYADALQEGDDQHLVIAFTFSENPMVASVGIEGESRIGRNPLLRAQAISAGDFFTPGMLSINASAIKDYYFQRGYRDAEVEYSYTENQEANTVDVLFSVTEGKQYKVRDILFQGISGLSAKDLDDVLTQKKRTLFSAGNLVMANITADESAIIMLYNSEGYPDARIISTEIVPTGEEDENVIYVNVVYTIDEGDRWTIGEIRFSGNEVFSDDAIRSLISIDPGDAYDAMDIAIQQEALNSLYYDNGYIRAMITLPMSLRVEERSTMWGEAVTIRWFSIICRLLSV